MCNFIALFSVFLFGLLHMQRGALLALIYIIARAVYILMFQHYNVTSRVSVLQVVALAQRVVSCSLQTLVTITIFYCCC